MHRIGSSSSKRCQARIIMHTCLQPQHTRTIQGQDCPLCTYSPRLNMVAVRLAKAAASACTIRILSSSSLSCIIEREQAGTSHS